MKLLIWIFLILFSVSFASKPELVELGRLTAEEILFSLRAQPYQCPFDKKNLAQQARAAVCGKAEMTAEQMIEAIDLSTPYENAWIKQKDGSYVNAYDTMDQQGIGIMVKNWGDNMTYIYILYPFLR